MALLQMSAGWNSPCVEGEQDLKHYAESDGAKK
jgi:hypothetical protein